MYYPATEQLSVRLEIYVFVTVGVHYPRFIPQYLRYVGQIGESGVEVGWIAALPVLSNLGS